MLINVGSASADSGYNVALCGYNAAAGQAGAYWNFNSSPNAASSCSITDARSGTQVAGSQANVVFDAPSGEAITAVSEAYAHYWASHTSSDEDWSVGLGFNIGGSATYYPQMADCSSNGSSHIYTYSGANALTTGCNNSPSSGGVSGLWDSNVGLVASCHASSCPSDGGSGATIDGLVVALADPDNSPSLGASGSLWNAANGQWISGLNEGSTLSMGFSASDPSTVCTLAADIVNTSGNAVASDQPVSTTNWNGSTFADSDPCAFNPSATFAPNLASLPSGTYYLNAVAQNAGNIESGGAIWASGSTWTQGRELLIDNTPPTQTLTPSANSSTWSAAPQTVTVNASDAYSGVDTVDCAGPGAPSNPIPASQLPYTITVSQNGSDTITCQAVDNAGNLATPSSVTLNIDSTTPTVQFSTTASSSQWYPSVASIPQVTVSGTTGPSGVQSFTCSGDGISSQSYSTTGGGTVNLAGLDQGSGQISCTLTSNSGLITTMTQTLNLDTTLPTLSFSTTESSSTWYTTNDLPEIDVDAATTGPSGVASITCSGDGLPNGYTISGASGQIPAGDLNQGSSQITCFSTSGAGNTSASQALTVQIDNTTPTVTRTTTADATVWYPSVASIPQVSIAGTVGDSGVSSFTCAGDGITSQSYATTTGGTVNLAGLDNGTGTITCTLIANNGLSATVTQALKLDTTVPTVAFSASTPTSLWYTSANLPQIIVNAATTGPSGVDHITCDGDGLPAGYTISGSTGSIPDADLAQGSGQVTCVSTSGAGVPSTVQALTVNVDNTVPTATLSSNADPNVWYASASSIPAVNVSTTSGPSGIAEITCQAPGSQDTITASSGTVDLTGLRSGTDTISCTPMSPTGVQGQPTTLTVQVDSQLPVVSFGGAASQTQWYPSVSAIPTLNADASTGPSGLASISCNGDGITAQNQTSSGTALSLAGLNQGSGNITCTATSVSGVQGPAQTFTINLDSAAPSAQWSTSESQTSWYSSTSSLPGLEVQASAGGPSGVDHIVCSGGGFNTPVTLAGASGALHPDGFSQGTNTISCVPYSGAGVAGPAITRTVLIDSAAPAVQLSGTDSNVWYPTAQTVAADASADTNPSGVQSIVCSVDGGASAATDGDHASETISSDGVHAATCHAVSGAGVLGAAATTTVKIDSQTPTVSQTVVPADPSQPSGTVAVLVAGSETNGLSGISSTSCSLDNQPATLVSGDHQTVDVTTAGQHTLTCSAVTGAGVVSAVSTQTYAVQANASQFSLQYGAMASSWQATPAVAVPVQLAGATAQDYSSMTCTVAGQSSTTIAGTSGTVNVQGSGSHQIACYATAANGANTAAVTQTVKIDTQTPTGTWSTRDTPTGAQITLLGSEATPLSGIASESCSVDGGAQQTANGPQLTVGVTGNGSHQLACSITTAAGVTANLNYTAHVSVPVLAPIATSTPDPTRWYRSAQTIVLSVPTGGPVIASISCTQDATTTSYPVSNTTTSVTVPATGGNVTCVDVDPSGQQSPAVTFAVHVDTTAPSGYFVQTGPTAATMVASDQGPSGIQGVTVQYQIGSAAWVTIPGTFDPSTGQVSVSLPSALLVPGTAYSLRAIAVNNAGAQTIITTMKNGSPATATSPATAPTSAPSNTPPSVQAGLQLARSRPSPARQLPGLLTVAYGQAVRLTGALRGSAHVAGQIVRISVTPGVDGHHRLTVRTDAHGRFSINLGSGPSRTVTYAIAGVSRTVTILVRGRASAHVTRSADRSVLRVLLAGATGSVRYQLQVDRHGTWRSIGGEHQTNRRGVALLRLPHAAHGRLRLLIPTQHAWRYLTTEVPA